VGFLEVIAQLLKRLVAPAEDPRQADRLISLAQPDFLGKLRSARLEVAAARQRLATAGSRVDGRLDELEATAREALTAGREDDARLALEQRYALTDERRQLTDQMAALEAEDQRLRRVGERFEARIEAIQRRWELASVRYTAAEAQVLINEALAGAGGELPGLRRGLSDAEETANSMHARASAIDDLTSSLRYAPRDATDDEIARIERAAAVAEQIETLKSSIRRQEA